MGSALGSQLRPVLPISLVTPGSGLYTALRQYKGLPNSIARRQRGRLSELLGSWLPHHMSCVTPGGFDVVTVVPSLQVSDQPHPLAAVLTTVAPLAEKVQEVLFASPLPEPLSRLSQSRGVMGRNMADPRAYRCRRETVLGSKILLVDDLYTTGAHIHSASAVLEEAGARSVRLLVVGRFARSEHPATRQLLERSGRAHDPWDVERCVQCVW